MRLGISSFAFFVFLFASRLVAAQCVCGVGSVLCKCEIIDDTIDVKCCGPGTVCIEKECQKAPPYCLEDTDCGEGRTCTESQRCTCASNADCGKAGLFCGEDKVCYALCDVEHPCQLGYTCVDSRCELSACDADVDCPLSECLSEAGHCAPYFQCTTNFHCRNVDTEFGGAPRICGPEGKCMEPAAPSAAAGCACSFAGGTGDLFVPVSVGMMSAAALFRLRAKNRRRSAARRSA